MFAEAGEAVLLSKKSMGSLLALRWLHVALLASCSTSEPVCTEEFVLMGERGTCDKEILWPLSLLSMGLPIRIVGDAVTSKLCLTFYCLSSWVGQGPGLLGSSSFWYWMLGV